MTDELSAVTVISVLSQEFSSKSTHATSTVAFDWWFVPKERISGEKSGLQYLLHVCAEKGKSSSQHARAY